MRMDFRALGVVLGLVIAAWSVVGAVAIVAVGWWFGWL